MGLSGPLIFFWGGREIERMQCKLDQLGIALALDQHFPVDKLHIPAHPHFHLMHVDIHMYI